MKIMSEINSETMSAEQNEAHRQIVEHRFGIDNLDREIIKNLAKYLAERSGYVDKIGQIKRNFKFAVHDSAREATQFKRYAVLARSYNTEPNLIVAIFRDIILWSRYRQRNGFRLVEDLRRRRPPGKIKQKP